jgi:hypothetical protein
MQTTSSLFGISKFDESDLSQSYMYMLTDWEKDLWQRIFIIIKAPSARNGPHMQVRYTFNKDESKNGIFKLNFRNPDIESTALR